VRVPLIRTSCSGSGGGGGGSKKGCSATIPGVKTPACPVNVAITVPRELAGGKISIGEPGFPPPNRSRVAVMVGPS
jgi:hypothetical protein